VRKDTWLSLHFCTASNEKLGGAMGTRICRELKKSKLGDERDFYSLLLMTIGGLAMSRKSWHPSTLNLILRVRHQLGLVYAF